MPVQLFRITDLLVGPATSGRSGVRVYKAGQSVCGRFGTDGPDGPDRTGRWLWWSLRLWWSLPRGPFGNMFGMGCARKKNIGETTR